MRCVEASIRRPSLSRIPASPQDPPWRRSSRTRPPPVSAAAVPVVHVAVLSSPCWPPWLTGSTLSLATPLTVTSREACRGGREAEGGSHTHWSLHLERQSIRNTLLLTDEPPTSYRWYSGSSVVNFVAARYSCSYSQLVLVGLALPVAFDHVHRAVLRHLVEALP